MGLSVDYLQNFVLSLIKKNQAGGLGNEDFERFWNDEQAAYQADLLGRFQAKNNGKTGINTGLIQDETILQKLSAFISPYPLTITNGKADKPKDFVYRVSLMSGNFNAYKINYNQRDSVVNSVIDPPSVPEDTFYFLEYEDYYEFIPNTLTSATLDYVKLPPNIKWGFTYDSEGRQVYNAGTSIQSLWDDNSNREICKRVLKLIGVSFKDNDFSNFGNTAVATGE